MNVPFDPAYARTAPRAPTRTAAIPAFALTDGPDRIARRTSTIAPVPLVSTAPRVMTASAASSANARQVDHHLICIV